MSMTIVSVVMICVLLSALIYVFIEVRRSILESKNLKETSSTIEIVKTLGILGFKRETVDIRCEYPCLPNVTRQSTTWSLNNVEFTYVGTCAKGKHMGQWYANSISTTAVSLLALIKKFYKEEIIIAENKRIDNMLYL